MKDFFKKLFCSHDYHLINQFTIPSQYDAVVESGWTPNSFSSLTRKYVSDYKCSNCNSFKRLEAKTSR